MGKRIAFVTNFCPHSQVRMFELLAASYDVDFLFYSRGEEAYWLPEHGVQVGNFRHWYLDGFNVRGTRVTPSLPGRLWSGDYDAFVTTLSGRFALPVTTAIAKARRRPLVLWTGLWSRVDTPAHRAMFFVTRATYRAADALVVYGEHVRRYLLSEGVDGRRVFTAPHAVDNELYGRAVSPEEKDALRRRLGIAPGQPVVLFLGRLEEEKGLGYLIDAFARIPSTNAVLVLAGTGSLRNTLDARARARNISDRVRFPGYVPVPQTSAFYSVATVYVLPSITTATFKEPWGLVVNEAFNQGLPVIATDAVGAAAGGLVRDGDNGFVVAERNTDQLATVLARIVGDADLRQRLSRGALDVVREWTQARMVDGFRDAIAFATQRVRAASSLRSSK